MNRLRYPEPNRDYLQAIEAIKYDIEQIEKGLRLNTDDPDPDGFKAVVTYGKHLYELLRIAAIFRDRELYNRCEQCGRDRHGYGGMTGKLCRYCDPKAYTE